MKKLLTLTLTLLVSLSFGQTAIKKENISTDGGSQTNGTTTVVYTVGEIAIQENSNGTIHLSEGFIGPDIITALKIDNYTGLQGVNIYPNPVQTDLNISLPEYQNYEIYLYDLNGKQLINTIIEDDNQTKLDLSTQKTGVYMLIVIDRNQQKRGIYKIQKL